MDFVFLEGLEIPCRVGCTDREREMPQSLRLNIRLGTSGVARAAATDDVSDTVDYGVARRLIAAVQGRAFRLIETVAEVLAETALGFEHVEVVQLKVWKRAPVESLKYSGVEIERRRSQSALKSDEVRAGE
ncbi:MAG: dihydroneopterin aldolase [Candidatus Schekmanbacteria bacterium]|nr:dihydroneopterin aldolase [Candidatus Schekmanbacteria bacterium]